MRTPLTAAVFILLGLILPIESKISDLPEDLEGSGNDLGNGSGDWSEEDDVTNIMGPPYGKGRTFDGPLWPAGDFIVSESRSFLENKQIVAGIIAGGVTGMILAILLVAILIYKWRNKIDGGYSQAQQTLNTGEDV